MRKGELVLVVYMLNEATNRKLAKCGHIIRRRDLDSILR